MTISISSSTVDLIELLNSRLEFSLDKERAPRLRLVESSSGAKAHDNESAPVGKFRAKLIRGLFKTVEIEPPEAILRLLGKTGSVADIDFSRASAELCRAAYQEFLTTSEVVASDVALRAVAIVDRAFSEVFDAAREVLADAASESSDEQDQEKFSQRCSLVGASPSAAQKAALRSGLALLAEREALALMSKSSIAFNIAPNLEARIHAKRLAATAAGEPTGRKPQTYGLYENGSFKSTLVLSSNDPLKMANALLDPRFSLGPEHAFHQHFLLTPDGEIHGVSSIATWAREALHQVAVFEIAESSFPGAPARAPSRL